MAEKAPKKEKEHLGSVLDDNHAARMKRGRWVWDHKVAIIVVAVLMFFGFMFREVVWSSLCWTWNAGRSVSKSASEQIGSTGSDDESYMVVKASPTNVRDDASTSSKKIAVLKAGDKVYPLAPAEKGWIKVRLENGKVGHIKADLLKKP